MINGKHMDWECIQIMGPGGLMVLAKSIRYNDGRDADPAYDGKGKISGRIRKGYTAEAELEVPRAEGDDLMGALGSGFMGKAEFSIIVAGGDDGSATSFSDTLSECVITGRELSASQDNEVVWKLTVKPKEILTNGVKPVV